MPKPPLHLAVCHLRTAHEAPWNAARRRAHLIAVQAQARVLAWQEIARQQRSDDTKNPASTDQARGGAA